MASFNWLHSLHKEKKFFVDCHNFSAWNVAFHIKTSYMICIGFYMKCNAGLKWFKVVFNFPIPFQTIAKNFIYFFKMEIQKLLKYFSAIIFQLCLLMPKKTWLLIIESMSLLVWWSSWWFCECHLSLKCRHFTYQL